MRSLIMATMWFVAPLAIVNAQQIDSVVDQVDHQGRVETALAQKTGWTVARGFQWRILVDEHGERQYLEVDPSKTLKTGQAFRVEVEADFCDLWIYMLNVDPNEEMTVLFPEKAEEHLFLKKGQKAVFPPNQGVFRLSDPPGKEVFRIIGSPTKLDWVNPEELAVLRGSTHKEIREKAVQGALDAQSKTRVEADSIDQLVNEVGSNPQHELRSKNVSLVIPQHVTLLTADQHNQDPIVIDIELVHTK